MCIPISAFHIYMRVNWDYRSTIYTHQTIVGIIAPWQQSMNWVISLAWQTWSQQSTLAIHFLIFLFHFYDTRLVIWYQVCRIGIKKKLWKVVFIYIYLPKLGTYLAWDFVARMRFFKIWWDNIFIILLVAVEILHQSTMVKKYIQTQNQIKSTSMQI